jgi:diguanylate cyclase (GGDEF)-like protein
MSQERHNFSNKHLKYRLDFYQLQSFLQATFQNAHFKICANLNFQELTHNFPQPTWLMNYSQRTQPTILLIDDDQSTHLWAKRNLTKAGFTVVSSFNGEQGLAMFNECAPNIIMIDIEMPKIDGITTCSEIRKQPNGKTVPIAMMTATENEEKITKSYNAGANEFIRKPVNWEILSHRLHFMVKASENLHKLAQNELRLSKTKQMARLGDWEWQLTNDKVYWSDEIYTMLETTKHDFQPNSKNYTSFIHPEDLRHVQQHIAQAFKNSANATIEFRVITATKREHFFCQQIEAIKNHAAKTVGLIGTVQDITERKNQELMIRHLAYYDEVTQLPNRVFFLKFLAKTIELAKRNSRNFAILFLDLDGFKGINDTYGHHVGDQLLQQISQRMTERLRCSDLASRYFDHFDHKIDVARLGGDEFIILLNELAKPEDAGIVAERIRRWITEPVILGERRVQIDASLGIAIYPHDGEDSNALMKNADIAMYYAKKMGKGHYQFFREEMALRAKKRLKMESYMNLALQRNELLLHLQPVIDVSTEKLLGAEALLRWQSAELGYLPPNDFISFAEENGMINQFGEWVIRQVCQLLKEWEMSGLGNMAIAINLSSLQINQPSFISMISDIISDYEINPNLLSFEITESMLMMDTDNMLGKLKKLKNLGITLAIDDFGTGYSSLSYLNRFPLDALKIDRSFIKDLPESQDSAAIVNAILALAKALNLKTIAEGVETVGQKSFLHASTCDAIQGYYYSKPLPIAEFEHFWQGKNVGSHVAV